MEASIHALMDFSPGSLDNGVKGVENLRNTGAGVELSVELFLLQLERFKADSQFETQEILPYEKVLRKAVPLNKSLYPPPVPSERPAEVKDTRIGRTRTPARDLLYPLKEEV